ncbi:hypothetical protein AB0J63_40745 [Streptosporangium canum]
MSTTNVTDYLTDLDDTLREIGEKLRPVIDPALFADWLRQAYNLEAR